MKKNKLLKFSMIFFIVSLALFCISFYKMEPDYLWHIKAGEYIFHHGLLKKDIFSWIIPGKYWMSHEWLFELIIYSLKYIFGKFHILIYIAKRSFKTEPAERFTFMENIQIRKVELEV